MTAVIDTDWEIEAEFAGVGVGWTPVTRDILLAAGIKVSYGMRDGWPTGLMADVGTLLCSLNNSQANSMSRLGLYTLGGAVCRGGFDYGMRFRFLLDGEVRFVGRLKEAPPTPGAYGDRDVRCRVVDWMGEAESWPTRGLPTQTAIRADQIVTAVVDAMPIQPQARSFDAGSDLFAYWASSNGTAGTELGDAVQSEMGRLYELGGTLTFEARHRRRNLTPQFVLDNSPYIDFDPGGSYQSENVKTRVETTVHPLTVDPALVILYTHQDKTYVAPGASVEIVCEYTNPTEKAARISGASIVTPAQGTDFFANTRADGLGIGMGGNLTVEIEPGGSSATVTLTNIHATVGLYVTTLRIRGFGVYDQSSVKCPSVASAAERAKYGENTVNIDLKFHSSATFGKAVSSGVRSFMGTPRLWNGTFRFCANTNTDLMAKARTANISTCFQYREDVTGISNWIINAVDLEVDSGNLLWVTWHCEPADLTHYWMLGEDVLGTGTIPAPF